jgi:hypothetical protein
MMSTREAEAAQVRELYRMLLEAGTLELALGAAQNQGITTKRWTSRNGVIHGGNPLNRGSLRRLLSNLLYRGSVSHKGTSYPGEHEAIVEAQIWEAVNERLQANSTHLRGKIHGTQHAPLAKLLYCGGCHRLMIATYTTRAGRKHRYYVCRSKCASGIGRCPGAHVAAPDLETAVEGWLEPIVGNQLSGPGLEQAIERIVYDGAANHVSTHLRDGTRLEYTLPTPNRGGVRRRVKEATTGRVPRISRLVALAIKLQGLVREGTLDTFQAAAELGHVTRARMSQIMRLADLAPVIQEELLFLPKTTTGPDRIYERRLRELTDIVDWERQQKVFRSLMDSGATR